MHVLPPLQTPARLLTPSKPAHRPCTSSMLPAGSVHHRSLTGFWPCSRGSAACSTSSRKPPPTWPSRVTAASWSSTFPSSHRHCHRTSAPAVLSSCYWPYSSPTTSCHHLASTFRGRVLSHSQRCSSSFQSSSHPQNRRSSSTSRRSGQVTRCRKDEKGNNSQRRSPPKSWRPWGWLQAALEAVRRQSPLELLINIGVLFFLMRLWPLTGRSGASQPQTVTVSVPFSEFVQRVRSNDVKAVSIDGNTMTFSVRQPSAVLQGLPEGHEPVHVAYQTVRPADYSTPYDTMLHNNIQFTAVEKHSNRFGSVMMYFLYAGMLLFVLNRLPLKLAQRGGAGRRHRDSPPETSITFDDVAGVDEAKEELQEVVEFLKAPERFSKLGARPPSGVLLVGPPGTGKTLLAKAVAGEAEVPFFSISASEFVELYVGMGAMRVRELFATARKEAPAIVFIDEIDAVAKGRDTRLRSVGNDEREQTLNQLLTELDGFESDKENLVICIAATNRPDVLDAALLRPGRFDRRVSVERPDRQGREEILQVHIKRRKLPLGEDVAVTSIAAATMGFTGADLANLVNEAALLAGRHNKGVVGNEDFDQAVLRAVAGVEKKRSILQGTEKMVVAKHEVGHALVGTAVARLIPSSAEVEKLSIVPRSGGALGFTYIPPKTEDRALMFDTEIRGQLAMLMGGRAAEEVSCGQISTGAVDDIRRATDLAYKSVSEYGLNAIVGPLSVATLANGGNDDGMLLLRDSGQMGQVVEEQVKLLLNAALAVAKDVITTNKKIHDGLSGQLETAERVEGSTLTGWLADVTIPASLRSFVLHGTLPNVQKWGK